MSAPHPFASLNELEEARAMLANGRTGRQIAEWFFMDLGPVAEWVAAQREVAR